MFLHGNSVLFITLYDHYCTSPQHALGFIVKFSPLLLLSFILEFNASLTIGCEIQEALEKNNVC